MIDDRGTVIAGPSPGGRPLHDAVRAAAVEQVSADIAAAVSAWRSRRGRHGGRPRSTALAAADPAGPPPPASPLPPATATPADVRRWWDDLTPAQRRWLVATEPGWLGPRDGVPAAYRDLANRLLLDEQRAELDRAIAAADGGELRRLRGLRDGLRRAGGPAGGRGRPAGVPAAARPGRGGPAVVALGDPDRAANVLTHVPGMTADLASYGGELSRAERVAVRAAELSPADVDQRGAVAGLRRAGLRGRGGRTRPGRGRGARAARFQDGLRATHDGSRPG